MPVESRPAVVFFDLDDTLFDHTFAARSGLLALADELPAFRRQPIERVAEAHARNLEAFHARVVAGELTLDEARVARFSALCRECGAADLDPEVVAGRYREAYMRARRAVPGAVELLDALRDRSVAIGIVTNNVVDEQVEKLRLLEMLHLVDVLVVSEEAGAAKPDPAIFRIALERAGCRPDQSVMLGDSWTVDVLGARGAGIPAVWLNRRGIACPEPRTCAVIPSLLPTAAVAAILLTAASPVAA
jgi:putative hydrolase of the HAD superfamily